MNIIDMGRLKERIMDDFYMKQMGIDFMGYEFNHTHELTCHHIKPKKDGGTLTYNNVALLVRNTGHNYIHLIEEYDYKLFLQITQQILIEKDKKQITAEQLRNINEMLLFFEDKFKNETNRKGELIIKESYVRKRVQL